MKNWIGRFSAAAFAAGLAGTAACGGMSSCSGTNVNSNSAATPSASVQCGNGTYLPTGGTQCIPVPQNSSSNNGTTTTAAPPKATVISN